MTFIYLFIYWFGCDARAIDFHYLGGEVVGHDGVDVDQLNFKMADYAALAREADHVIVSVACRN